MHKFNTLVSAAGGIDTYVVGDGSMLEAVAVPQHFASQLPVESHKHWPSGHVAAESTS